MLPILRVLGDGEVHRVVPDITDPVSEEFHLTQEEREQMLPSGLQATFANRAQGGYMLRKSSGRIV